MSHLEEHFLASELVRDIVIGMSDGLTVPFAIAAGMSGAAVAAKVVVTAGQTISIGGLAAGVAFGIARLLGKGGV